MIARVWKGTAPLESADAYQQHVRRQVFPKLSRLDGYVSGLVLRHDEGSGVDFLVITQWTSLEAIRAFAGDDIERAVVEPDARALLSYAAPTARHFQIVATDGDVRRT
jgi:heme-degrading monooxygenase HmoA